MIRFTMLAAAILVLAGASNARSQDTDEVKRLKAQIELLQAKLEAANLKVEKLEAEVAKLKGGGGVGPASKQSLSDRLSVGAVARGEYAFTGADGEVGTASLTITERDGNKVKGKYDAKKRGAAEAWPGFEFEGTISGNTLTAKSVGSAVRKTLTVTTVKGGGIDGTVVNVDRRTTARVSFKLDE